MKTERCFLCCFSERTFVSRNGQSVLSVFAPLIYFYTNIYIYIERMKKRTIVCGNKQSVFSARHDSLLARAHSIFRHCLIDCQVFYFFTSYKSKGEGFGYISNPLSNEGRKNRINFDGNFSMLEFKLGSFFDTLRRWHIGVESFSGLSLGGRITFCLHC